MRRSYAGGVRGVTLTAPITDISTSMSVSNLTGVPSGSNGPFAVVVDKGLPNEEKMLVSGASGGSMTISTRGYDGTIARAHAAAAEVRLIITAVDADEANSHVNATTGVHGAPVGVALVNATGAATLTNKTIDGDDNTIRDIKLALSPELVTAFGTEADARAAGDAARYTKAETNAAFAPIAQAQTLLDLHEADPDPHEVYVKSDNAVFRRLPVASLPVASSGRRWASVLTAQTISDANPQRVLGSILVPAAPSGLGSTRIVEVKATIMGFTTTGIDTDVCRFHSFLNCDLGTQVWFGFPGSDNPYNQWRLNGGLVTPAGGHTLSAFAEITMIATTISFGIEKVSGVNATAVIDHSALQIVQMV